ncbi:MAG: energy transducer TonB family protein [Stellaceae bacterium]
MTDAAAPLPFSMPARGGGLRWSASLAIVLALHALVAVLLLNWHVALPPAAAVQSVAMIDLQPLPAPPQPAIEPPRPKVQPEIVKPVEPTPEPKPKPVVKPKPKPRPHPVVEHPVPVPIPAPAPVPSAPAPQAAAPLPPQTAPQPSNAMPSFRDRLAAYLARYKRYPHAAQVRGEQGVVLVAFVLDRQGGVSGAHIEHSSGHSLLDEEVLSLLQRAAPLPPIPLEIAGARLDITVPIAFTLR